MALVADHSLDSADPAAGIIGGLEFGFEYLPVSWVDVACEVLLFPDKAMFVSLDIT